MAVEPRGVLCTRQPGDGWLRLIVLTCNRRGTASRILPAILDATGLDVVQVVLSRGVSPQGSRRRWRLIRKVSRIGVLGALNGIRMRDWYRDDATEDIEPLCRGLGVPLIQTPYINCDETVRIFREARADLGLSLGNGYIGEKVFAIPRYGMINLHSEVLPAFQGASSVIWPIHENVPETGFTIHQVNRSIDDGDILYVEKWPIVFGRSLAETVRRNVDIGRQRAPAAMVKVCQEYQDLRQRAVKQTGGGSFTTPTFGQFLRMLRNHARMRAEAAARAA